MVIIKLWGGVGNQLFQYSFGKYLSIKLGTEVKYDIQTTSSFENFTNRDYGLSQLKLNLVVASAEEVKKIKKFRKGTSYRLVRKLAQIFPFLFKNYLVEPKSPLIDENLKLRDDCYYDGYWQSYKYILSNESNLRNEFIAKYPLNLENLKRIHNIESTFSISIHVRRGDYLNLSAFNICTMDYYEAAIRYFTQRFQDIKFYIFSDDLPWCKENFKSDQFVFITGNQPCEDILLMSKCKHNIIANSTFSWWAAWLNENPQKIVIAPKKWYKEGDSKVEDLLPANWIRIDSVKQSHI